LEAKAGVERITAAAKLIAMRLKSMLSILRSLELDARNLGLQAPINPS